MKTIKLNFDILNGLVMEWENIARNKFDCIKHTDDPTGIQLLNNGAMCYFNCDSKLREVLSMPRPEILTTEGEDQK